jgi:hypothetical protein
LIPPQVQIVAPAGGSVVGGGGPVRVHWTVTNPAQSPLTAQIDYSIDNGASWRTIYVGPNDSGDGVALPSFYFAASRQALVRVRVNDGFNETAAVSAPFTALDTPPQVTILSPAESPGGGPNTPPQAGPRIAGDARVQLGGEAFDQQLRSLSADSLRWFDGRVPLGTGSTLDAGPLPPGVNLIRLVARDAAGRRASASITVTVNPVHFSFLRLTIPSTVGPLAHQLTLGALSAFPVTLVVDGQRFPLRAGATQELRVPITPGTTPRILHMAIRTNQIAIPFAARVRRA